MKLGTEVSLAVRAPEVVARLTAAGLPGLVGPERDGWTPVRVPPGPPVGAYAAATGGLVLAAEVDLDDDRLTLLGWRDGGAPPGGPAAASGRPEAAAEVERLVGAPPGPDLTAAERAERAAVLLGVPAGVLTDPRPERELAVLRGNADSAGTAGAVAGGAWLAEDGGWSLLVPTRPGVPAVALAAGLSEAGRRRDPALWLWRGGDECGYLLWRRGRTLDGHVWQPPWTLLPGTDEDFGPTPGDAAVLAAAVGRPDAEVPLRALLRRREPAATVLPELAGLLGLPTSVPAVLAGTELRELPGARAVEQRSVLAAVRQEARREEERRARTTPPWRTWLGLVTYGLLAVVAAGMAVFGVALLVTDGAAGDQDGTGPGDWASTAVFVVLTVLFARDVRRRVRRLRG